MKAVEVLALVGLGQAAAFICPAPVLHGEMIVRGRWSGAHVTPYMAAADMSTGASSSGPAKPYDVNEKLRDMIWKATDAVMEAVEPNTIPAKPDPGLENLGNFLMNLDDKYFNRASATGAYLDSISTPKAKMPKLKSPGGGSAVAEPPQPPEKEVAKPAAAPKAAAPRAPEAPAATTTTVKVPPAPEKATKDVRPAPSKAVAPAPAPVAEGAGAGAGTAKEAPKSKTVSATAVAADNGGVDLQRPEPVREVFDDLQKRAVAFYKTMGPDTSGAVGAAAVSAAELEGKLERLLDTSRFQPSQLGGEGKADLVAAIEALEKAYPANARAVKDPALFGTWSLVYSSSTKPFRAMLGNKRSKLFKMKDPCQKVDTAKMSVTNTCTLRLRNTPLSLGMRQEGVYTEKAGSGSGVEVAFSRGRLGRVLGIFRKGSVPCEVTYVSKMWRVCRSGDELLAFRKVTRQG